eukprot:4320919-Prymnesium_polylepis.1
MSASSRRIATALAGEPGIVSDRSRCSRGAQRRSRQQCHGSRPLWRPSQTPSLKFGLRRPRGGLLFFMLHVADGRCCRQR